MQGHGVAPRVTAEQFGVAGVLAQQAEKEMSRWAALVREGIDLVGPDTAAGERLAEQAAFLEFATREMAGLLTRWEKYRASLPPIA